MLVSTLDLRLWMGIEEGDNQPNAKLETVSKAVEDFVDSWTNRKLQARTYFQDNEFSYLDGSGKRYIYLPQFPVSYVSSVHIDSDRVFANASLLASADSYWYPSGKVMSEGGNFTNGRRNILVHYTAGYAPVVNGTFDSAVSSYPIPLDLKQTMIEMTVESFKEGITLVHSVQAEDNSGANFIQMLSQKSFWRATLNKYKNFSASLAGRWE